MKTILFTGGGSAGHVIPNLALIPLLREKANIIYAGTNGIEKTLLSNTGILFCRFSAPKLVRGSILKNLSLPIRAVQSLHQAKEILKEQHPDLVFSKGGYVSLPIVLQAKRMHIPVLSHESDFSAGLANKIIARHCKTVLTSFPETAFTLKNGKYCGSPVRSELLCADRTAARKKYGFTDDKPVLLIFGGGSGSRTINETTDCILSDLLSVFNVLHIRGNHGETTGFSGYVPLNFEQDMASAYGCADYVLSRAGSNTVFEILALKKPALLIPLENGRTRGDQVQNALYFHKRGLVHVLREKELNGKRLLRELILLKNDTDLQNELNNTPFQNSNQIIVSEILNLLQ